MGYSGVDWLLLWRFYHFPLYFCGFIAAGVPLRAMMARRYAMPSRNSFWLASSTASSLSIIYTPIAAIPVFFLVALLGSKRAIYSTLIAIPMSLSIGAAGALVDAAILRLLFPQTEHKKKALLLFATNALNAAIAIGIVLAWMSIYPPNVIAYPAKLLAHCAGFRG
jgi:hypothetical protein